MRQVFAAIARSGVGSASEHQHRRTVKRERGQWKRFLSPGGARRPGR